MHRESQEQLRVDSTEGECVRLGSGFQKLGLEASVANRAGLPDELIQPRFGQSAAAFGVDVCSMRRPRRLSIEQDAKREGLASRTAGLMTSFTSCE